MRNRIITVLEHKLYVWFQNSHTKHETWKHFLPEYDAIKVITCIDDLERDGILRFTRQDSMYKLSVEEDIELDVGV